MSSFSFYTKWIAFFHSLGKPRYSKIVGVYLQNIARGAIFIWIGLESFIVERIFFNNRNKMERDLGSHRRCRIEPCNPFSLTMLVYFIYNFALLANFLAVLLWFSVYQATFSKIDSFHIEKGGHSIEVQRDSWRSIYCPWIKGTFFDAHLDSKRVF